MLPWSLRSAARRLAAATRAAASAAVAARSPAPAPWQERPPAVEDREERAAVWEDDHWPRRRPRRSDFSCTTKASTDHSGLTRQLLDFQHDTVDETDGGYDPFSQLKERFTDFKQRNYVENFTNYQKLAEQQTPEV
uniref:Uncharacterized protein n=1 Tax=Triticum urartu TaxID=4572 RepID=A0A8R7UKP6_TRIUA